ncbi:MAG: Zinc finger, CCHC domain-containing protein [Candelina mexicana]|nr:MAG: Zinc finger, CCHC domain-containing protein [Candelina mexicana]
MPASIGELELPLDPNPTTSTKDATAGSQSQNSAVRSNNDERHEAALPQTQNATSKGSSTNIVNLEDRIRGMIVGNATRSPPSEPKTKLPPHMRTARPQAQQKHLAQMDKVETKSVDAPKAAEGSVTGASTPRKRFNQKQRREMKTELDIPLPATPPSNQGRNPNKQQLQHPLPPRPAAQNQEHTTRQQQQWRRPQEPRQQQSSQGFRSSQPPKGHPAGPHTQTQSPQLQRGSVPRMAPGGVPFQDQIPNYPARQPPPIQLSLQQTGYHRMPPPPDSAFRSGPSVRPPPQNRQLYQPHGQGNGSRGPIQPSQPTLEEIHAQSHFLEDMAKTEVQNAEMSADEYHSKETFRALLEDVCRKAIGLYEAIGHEDLPRVTLKCFGSLSSGFATKSSDMDLALLSPLSVPEVSSFDSPIPRLLEKAFLDLGYGARLLTRTRVPIIKICEKPTPMLLVGLKKEREEWELHKDDPPEQRKKKITPDKGKSGAVSQPKPPHAVDEVTEINDDMSPNTEMAQLDHGFKEAIAFETVNEDQHESRALGSDAVDDKGEDESETVTSERGLITEASPNNNSQSSTSNPQPKSEELPEKPLTSSQPANHPSKSATPKTPNARPPRDTSLEFPKTGIGIQCDLNFSNHLALHNTLLLRCYSHADPRVRPMVIFVKAWAKTRTINSPYHGTLSSYGYVLMVLHYLVNVATPPVVPNLQLMWQRSKMPEGEGIAKESDLVKGYDVRFWRDEEEIRACAGRKELTQNNESLGALLRGFFIYYAQQGISSPKGGFNWSQSVLSLRTPGGLLSKREKGWTGARTTVDGKEVEKSGTATTTTVDKDDKPAEDGGADNGGGGKGKEGKEAKGKEIRHRYLVAIEDPFETEHNVARTVGHFGVCAIRDEIRRAKGIVERMGRETSGGTTMGRGEVLGGLFDEGPDREMLEREARERERRGREVREKAVRERGERERVEKERVEKEKSEGRNQQA